MTTAIVLGDILAELAHAKGKHGTTFASPAELWGALSLEVEEVRAEIQRKDLDRARAELHQVAAVAIKGIQSIDRLTGRKEAKG